MAICINRLLYSLLVFFLLSQSFFADEYLFNDLRKTKVIVIEGNGNYLITVSFRPTKVFSAAKSKVIDNSFASRISYASLAKYLKIGKDQELSVSGMIPTSAPACQTDLASYSFSVPIASVKVVRSEKTQKPLSYSDNNDNNEKALLDYKRQIVDELNAISKDESDKIYKLGRTLNSLNEYAFNERIAGIEKDIDINFNDKTLLNTDSILTSKDSKDIIESATKSRIGLVNKLQLVRFRFELIQLQKSKSMLQSLLTEADTEESNDWKKDIKSLDSQILKLKNQIKESQKSFL